VRFVDGDNGLPDAAFTAEFEDPGLTDGSLPVSAIASTDTTDRRDGPVPSAEDRRQLHLDEPTERLLSHHRHGPSLFDAYAIRHSPILGPRGTS
jgi:hypothetical protein